MATGEKILHSDVIEKGNPLQTLRDGLVEVSKLIDEVNKKRVNNPMTGGKDAKEDIKYQTSLNVALKQLYKSEDDLLKIKTKMAVVAEKQRQANETELGTLGKIKAENKQLRKELDQLDLTKQKGLQRQNQINDQLDKNTKTLYRNSDAYTKQKMDIGKYTNALNGAWRKVLQFAGGLGVAFGAMETFKSVIAATDFLTDKFQETLSSVKEVTNLFGRAIANLDFQMLITGFSGAWQEGKRYAETLDLINNLQNEATLKTKDIDIEISRLKGLIRLQSTDLEERKKYLEQIKVLEQQKLDITETVANKTVDNELTNAAKIAGFHGDTIEEGKLFVKKFIENYSTYTDALEEGKKIEEELSKISPYKVSIMQMLGLDKAPKISIDDLKKYTTAFDALTEQQKEALKLYRIEFNLGDEGRAKITAALGSQKDAIKAQVDGIASLSRITNTVNKADETYINNQKTKLEWQQKETNAIYELAKAEDLRNEEQRLKSLGMAGEAAAMKLNLEKTSSDASRAMMESDAAFEADLLQKGLDDTKRVEDEKKAAYQAAFDLAVSTANAIFQLQNQSIQNEIQQAENLRDYKIQLAGDDVKAKTKAEQEYQAKMKELKTKEAKNNKNAALFNTIINTAVSIMRAYSDLGPIAGTIAAILLAGLGVAQIAAIESQPLPSYRKGTKYLKANGTGTDKDGILVQAHHGERILTAEQNKQLGNIENNQLPGLVYLGRKYETEWPLLAAIQEKTYKEQQKTNGLLKRFKFVDKDGNIITMEGNIVKYV